MFIFSTAFYHVYNDYRTHTGDKPYKCRHPGCNKGKLCIILNSSFFHSHSLLVLLDYFSPPVLFGNKSEYCYYHFEASFVEVKQTAMNSYQIGMTEYTSFAKPV